jgi:hypothetical protein
MRIHRNTLVLPKNQQHIFIDIISIVHSFLQHKFIFSFVIILQ